MTPTEKLREALESISKWEMPNSGRFEDGIELSYSYCFGSNGEREVIRKRATEALAILDTLPEADNGGAVDEAIEYFQKCNKLIGRNLEDIRHSEALIRAAKKGKSE